jgi:hypothetical protein
MTLVLRIGLVLLAATMLTIGAWNQFWPRGFFDHFPTVYLLPPYSEHFSRDFGGAALGLGIVAACAAAMPRTVLVVPVLLGVWAWSLPHAVFHFAHLHHGSAADAWFNVIATGSAAALPAVLLAVAAVRARRDRRARSTG